MIGFPGRGETTLSVNFIYKSWIPYKNLYGLLNHENKKLIGNYRKKCKNVENE